VAKKIIKDNRPYLKTIYILTGVIAVQSLLLLSSCFRRKEDVTPKKVFVRVEEPQKIKKQKELAPRQKVQTAVKQKEQPKEEKPVILQDGAGAKIAIVLDDWGYSLNNVKILREIDEPLTLAILPRRTYSEAIAKLSLELGKEAILHLPLESYQGQESHPEPDTISSVMQKAQVLKILDKDIKSVTGIKGVSNHQGSRATESKPLMKIILTDLKKRNLFFLDSFTGKTVCKELAKDIAIPYARRQVFLDNKNEPRYILGQIELLAKIARQSGYAIGIGHDRQKTLEVLEKVVPELKKRGFRFVRVSELVK